MKVVIDEKHILAARQAPFMACYPEGMTDAGKFNHISAIQERTLLSEAMGGNKEYIVPEKHRARLQDWLYKFRFREVLEIPFFFEVDELIKK